MRMFANVIMHLSNKTVDPYKQELFKSHFVLSQAAALLSRRVLMMEVGHRLWEGADEECYISRRSWQTQFVWNWWRR